MNDQETQEFIAVWKEEFGEELTPAEAVAQMDRLCVFFEQLADAENVRQSEAES